MFKRTVQITVKANIKMKTSRKNDICSFNNKKKGKTFVSIACMNSSMTPTNMFK